MGAGKPLFAKLFLECKEVPFIGATVTHSVNQAAIAYIDLPPHQEINHIKPRTLVHLFIRDFNKEGFPWILMFEGEVFGYNFGKTTDSRTFSISCIDKSGYWDNALLYFFNAQQSLGKGADYISSVSYDLSLAKAMSGGASGASQAVTHSQASFFKSIIEGEIKKGGDFLDGLVAVYKKLEKINEFYALAEDRLHITDRILLRSSGELTKLLREQEGLDWFSGITGHISGFSTLRMVVQDLMSILFHDFTPVPFPAKVSSTQKLRGPGISTSKQGKKTVGEFLFKPNLYMLPPPACNIFFPEEYSSYQFSRNFFQEPTRMVYKPELPFAPQSGKVVSLPHTYQPQSFANFMLPKTAGKDMGDGELQTDEDYGSYGNKNNDGVANVKREYTFLTNEEKMRGVLMAVEHMVPASNQFRASLGVNGRDGLYQSVSKYLFFKKRFETRQLQITSHLKPSVVPGFPVLVLDDSEASQNVLAYCSSVTHRIYATQGGYTNTTLGYARTIDEQDTISNKRTEPPVPPWFSKELFGETVQSKKGTYNQVPEKFSSFYKTLLGDKGHRVITDLSGTLSSQDAVKWILDRYRAEKSRGVSAVQKLISDLTSRDYVTMREAFEFIGAGTAVKDENAPWLEFSGYRVSGGEIKYTPDPNNPSPPPTPTKDLRDAKQIIARRAVIDKYRAALRKNRGFRG